MSCDTPKATIKTAKKSINKLMLILHTTPLTYAPTISIILQEIKRDKILQQLSKLKKITRNTKIQTNTR